MRSFIIFFAAIAAASAQTVNLWCSFQMIYNSYGCILNNIVVLDETRDVTVGGSHLQGRTNADVRFVHVVNSNTPFMIRQVFSTFPNIVELLHESCNLRSINIPSTVQLHKLTLYGNNITVIENGRFRGQTRLVEIRAINNNIQMLEENAFEGLERLLSLTLMENGLPQGTGIRTLAPKVFHHLISLESLDLMGNFISRIDATTFSANRSLRHLYLGQNQISAISPHFADNLRSNLNYLNLSTNVCVDRLFTLNSNTDWNDMFENLQFCFRNFGATSPGKKRIMFDFEGQIDILDATASVITRV